MEQKSEPGQAGLEPLSTIADIAAKAGVSIPTVSRVLNKRPDVALATRERVERIIKESGFVRNNAARALRKGSTGLVDIVVPGLESDYMFEVIRGVDEVLERVGLRLALSVIGRDMLREREWLENMANRSTDGVILITGRGHSEQLEELRRRKIPFVVVDHRGEIGPDVPSVGATNWYGARIATEYLLSLGHRRIATISGNPTLRCSLDRIAGYRSAMEAAGVPIDPDLQRPGDFQQEMAYEETCALLALQQPPTAILTGNDIQAVGAYSALRAHAISVPESMSVIGFDDLSFTTLITPQLTTVRQPLIEMGRIATTMLLRLIAGEPFGSIRIELSTILIKRESCAAPSIPFSA